MLLESYLLEGKDPLSYMANSMTTDGPSTWGAWASAAMVLAYYSWYVPVPEAAKQFSSFFLLQMFSQHHFYALVSAHLETLPEVVIF